MRRAVDFSVYLAFRTVWAVAECIPLPALRAILERLGHLAYHVDRRHRGIVIDNLLLAFPDWTEARRARAAKAAFANWGRIAAELAHVATMADARTMAALRAVQERLDAISRPGVGLLVLTAHTGNFELLGRLWGMAGRPLTVFHRPLSNRFVDAFLERERAKAGVATLGRGVGVRAVLRSLARGEVIAAPLDQNQQPGRGVFVEMFGREASTSTLLARLSLASGAPVLPVFATWEGDRLVPIVGEPIDPLGRETGLRSAAITELTRRYTEEIESAVRLAPEQWNWAHRRWKTRPPTRAGADGGMSGSTLGDYHDGDGETEIRGNVVPPRE